MAIELSAEQSAIKILELQSRLDEYEHLIAAIKGGEVDAFALMTNNKSEIFTLNSVDYAYRLLVESFEEGAINLSEEGLIVYTNNYFPELLNLPYEDVISNSFFKFIHPESREVFNELFKTGLKTKTKGEVNLIVNDKTIPVYISLTSLFPTIPTIGMIITDLTEKKKHEEILRMKNAQLETKNNELQAFAFTASHDLEGPLRKIQLFISRIVEKERANLSEKGKDYLERVQESANRMQVLVQDLLNFSLASASKRKFENIALNQIIDEVKIDLKEELSDKNATIETTGLGKARIIPFQFRQLLHNLISNALKYAQPTQSPHIIIKNEIAEGFTFDNLDLSPDKKYCHISISDNGIGFDTKYREKIFEMFYRLHEEAEYKGTGIGLSIVKKIVENHDGVITARSKINKGTTFDIYLPA